MPENNEENLCPFCKKNPTGSFWVRSKKTGQECYICDVCASTNPVFRSAANSDLSTN